MDPDRTALVVVDVQNGFITDLSRPVIPVIADLVSRWTTAGRPLVFTRYLNHPGSMFEKLLDWRKVAHSPETDIVAELASAATGAHVVDKHGYTLFNDTGRALVAEQGWTDLVFCGIDTEICVLKSAVDAFEAGITPWIITDASASHSSQAAHDAGIFIGRRFIGAGQFVTEADVSTTASHQPQFGGRST